jgi:hypothetical protein
VYTVEQFRKEHEAYVKVLHALTVLTPAERVFVMDMIAECYCLGCGYPAPPDGEECVGCSDTNGDRA